jgi:hypothetical protein
VIFHTFALSEAYSEKYRSQEVALNKLEKGHLRDYETAFCSLGSGEDLGKYSEFRNHVNKF